MSLSHVLEGAIDAWLTLSGERISRDEIQPLRANRDTVVYRFLSTQGPIVAKRCPLATSTVEQTVYEHLLPELSLPSLHYHGSSVESAGEFSWLFVEDAGGEEFDPRCESHRSAAAEWLADLHCSVERQAACDSLPSRRPDHYRELLAQVLDMLRRQRFSSSSLTQDVQSEFDAVMAHCRRLAERWAEIEEACEAAPDTLVHGDIVTHNVRLRSTPSGLVFLPFDWEKAGWGTAAEDLSDVNLDVYQAAVEGKLAERGAAENTTTIRRMAGAGKAFRCLVFLEWLGHDLATDSVDAFDQLRLCRSWLDAIVESSPWKL